MMLIRYRLIKTMRRLTLDILYQDLSVTYMGEDDGPYFRFTASNGYEVISRSRMDIQTERIWLLGAKYGQEPRSGTMVFSDNAKRDAAYANFVQAINEWAAHNGGTAELVDGPGPAMKRLLEHYDNGQLASDMQGVSELSDWLLRDLWAALDEVQA